jgi:hypothetical protein
MGATIYSVPLTPDLQSIRERREKGRKGKEREIEKCY